MAGLIGKPEVIAYSPNNTHFLNFEETAANTTTAAVAWKMSKRNVNIKKKQINEKILYKNLPLICLFESSIPFSSL